MHAYSHTPCNCRYLKPYFVVFIKLFAHIKDISSSWLNSVQMNSVQVCI